MADLHQFPDISRVLISEEQLQQTVQRIAQEINDTYADAKKPLLMVGILKGSVEFIAHLEWDIALSISKNSSQD